MSSLKSDNSQGPTAEGAYIRDCFNPHSEGGNINTENIQIGCSSRTEIFIGAVNVNPGETGQIQAKNSRKITQSDVKEMKEKNRCMYKCLKLPLVPWMRGANLSLEEYYIPLTLCSKNQMAFNEMEDSSEKSDDSSEESDDSSEESDDSSAESDDSSEESDNLEDGWYSADESDNLEDLWYSADESDMFDEEKCSSERGHVDEDEGHETQLSDEMKYELKNIFDAVQGNQPQRILVESQPGFGKSTLAHKVIHDWVLEKDYVRHFEYAILIILKHLKDQSLREAVIEELEMEAFDEECVWNVVNNANTLLLLDGLDEIDKSAKQIILKILCDKYDNRMTIVTTCRTGLFKLGYEEMDNLFKGKAVNDEFWDTRVKIVGLTGDNRQSFLDKFVEDNSDKTSMLEHINRVIAPLKHTFDSPLLLILLTFVISENPEYEYSKRTELFKNLVDYMVKRSIGEKRWRELGQHFSLFNRTTRSDYHDMLSKFGEVSVANIWAGNLQFECNDLLDEVFRMGFLKKHETQHKLNSNVFYESFHMTFLEFAAAYSLWDDFEKNGKQFALTTVCKINEICLRKSSTSSVIPFLCGLMGNDVEQFFHQFTDFCGLYSIDPYLMDSIFFECGLSPESCQVVEKFVPKVYNCSKMSSTILTNQNCKNCNRTIIINFDDLWRVAKNSCVVGDFLFVKMADVTDILRELSNTVQFKNMVKCKYLFIDMQHGCETYDQISAQLKILFSLSTDYKCLFIWGKSRMLVFDECVKNNVVKHEQVDYLRCILLDCSQKIVDAIINVISNNAVRELVVGTVVTNHDEHPVDALISVAASKCDLNSIEISNFSSEVFPCDMSVITSNGNKRWSHLSVRNVKIIRNVPDSNICIRSLEIFGGHAEVNVDALLSFTPTQLRLSYDLFHFTMISKVSILWAGLMSIEDLTLLFGGQTTPLQSLAELHRFKNLKRLQLSITGYLTQEQQSEIVGYLNEAVTDQLKLCWRDEDSSSAVTLVTELSDLIKNGVLKSFTQIDFAVRLFTTSRRNCDSSVKQHCSSCFSAINSAITCDYRVTAHVIRDGDADDDDLPLIFNVIDYSQVSIEQVIKVMDFPFARYLFVEFAVWPVEIVLKIQKKI